jgi:hypothetical protein
MHNEERVGGPMCRYILSRCYSSKQNRAVVIQYAEMRFASKAYA